LEKPYVPIPVPTDGPQRFKLKGQTFGSDVYVSTEAGEKWLFLDNKSGWFESHAEVELQTYKSDEEESRVLARCVIDGGDYDMKLKDEWEGDSDDSEFSLDDLFDFDDDDVEHKVKLKWKVAREAKFYDGEGNKFCTMKFKVKGKSKAEVTFQENDEGEMVRGPVSSTTKVKKAYHKIKWEEHLDGDDHISLDFDNGHWHDWDRTFQCGLLKSEYDAKWGVDVVTVDTKENVDPVKGLLVGFAIAYFFHPSRFASEMDGHARARV